MGKAGNHDNTITCLDSRPRSGRGQALRGNDKMNTLLEETNYRGCWDLMLEIDCDCNVA